MKTQNKKKQNVNLKSINEYEIWIHCCTIAEAHDVSRPFWQIAIQNVENKIRA